jgi:hypothetical protein
MLPRCARGDGQDKMNAGTERDMPVRFSLKIEVLGMLEHESVGERLQAAHLARAEPATGAKTRDFSRAALLSTRDMDSPLEGSGFELVVPPSFSSWPDSPRDNLGQRGG